MPRRPTLGPPRARCRSDGPDHTATLLKDGRVLVVGGRGRLTSAEIWDPETGRWTPGGNTVEPRSEHTATLLPDGTVLVAGGPGKIDLVEIYDPETGSWTQGPRMVLGRYSHTATALQDGRVVIAGGTGKDGYGDRVVLTVIWRRTGRPRR